VSRALLLAAVVMGGVSLGACHKAPLPSAQDLTACGTVNNMVAGVYVIDTLSEREASVATLTQQADLTDNVQLITATRQLRAATVAQNEAGVSTYLTALAKACTSLGVGPGSGGL
jgi:hypothetical protein